MTLADAVLHVPMTVVHVAGERAFRRRLMEIGLVPGTSVSVKKVAPLGDPLELRARGCSLSIRAAEARAIEVEPGRELGAERASDAVPGVAGALAG